jgi:hypothetical protein
MAVSAKPGACRSARTAKRTSAMIPSKIAIGRRMPKHYLVGRSMSRAVGSLIARPNLGTVPAGSFRGNMRCNLFPPCRVFPRRTGA